MTGPLQRARSIEELHLFLDLRGWQPERAHRLIVVDNVMRAVYRGRLADGSVVEAAFAPVPALPREAPSALIDAAQWYRLACGLARSVPAGPGRTQPTAQTRLRQAIGYLDETLRFAVPGAATLPPSAFWSPEGRAALEREPERFEIAMLAAEARAWRRLLA